MGPEANALYHPSFSPITTIPAWAAAPRSATNCPTKTFSFFMSRAGTCAALIGISFWVRSRFHACVAVGHTSYGQPLQAYHIEGAALPLVVPTSCPRMTGTKHWGA